jgi:hypothetical protein
MVIVSIFLFIVWFDGIEPLELDIKFCMEIQILQICINMF